MGRFKIRKGQYGSYHVDDSKSGMEFGPFSSKREASAAIKREQQIRKDLKKRGKSGKQMCGF